MSPTVVLRGLEEVRASAGTVLGPTEWVEVTEERLAAWEQACPGAPVGWLLLSLTNLFLPQMLEVADVSAGLNLGTGTVRLLAEELPPGTNVRGRATIESADDAKAGVQTVIAITVESSDATPLVEVQSLTRWLE